MNLPKELKSVNRWLVTKNDKIPRYITGTPRSGQLGTEEDLKQLATFELAKNNLNDIYPFLGFALISTDNIIFIDLDKVLDQEGQFISPDVKQLVDDAYELGAYVEVLMSGTGLHLFGFGNQQAFKKDGIEVYSDKRYCAITGKQHPSYPFQNKPLPELNEVATI